MLLGSPARRPKRSMTAQPWASAWAGCLYCWPATSAHEADRGRPVADEQRKAPSKYQEILDMLMTLDVGEAAIVPRGKVSADGLRQACRLPGPDVRLTSERESSDHN